MYVNCILRGGKISYATFGGKNFGTPPHQVHFWWQRSILFVCKFLVLNAPTRKTIKKRLRNRRKPQTASVFIFPFLAELFLNHWRPTYFFSKIISLVFAFDTLFEYLLQKNSVADCGFRPQRLFHRCFFFSFPCRCIQF